MTDLPVDPTTLAADDRVSIADASRLLSVPMPTLRSWELRYDIPRAPGEPGRHRRYDRDELNALRLMRDEIARGKRAGVAAQTVRGLLGRSGPASELTERFLLASERRDPVALRNYLDSAVQSLGLGGALDDVLMPALQRIGVWWRTGRCDFGMEQLTTETVRAWLDDLTATAPSPQPGRNVVLACGPSDLHTVGLEALTLLLRHNGVRCRLLGARTSVTALLTAVQATGASVVVVVSHLSTGRHRAVEAIRAADQQGALVFYAGNAFSTPRSRRAVPGTYLGVRLQDAAGMVLAAASAQR